MAREGIVYFCAYAGWTNCTKNGIMDYGEDTGCSALAPNFTQIFEEISEWYSTLF